MSLTFTRETVDAPATRDTPYEVAFGSYFQGKLQNLTDIDAVRFNVTSPGIYGLDVRPRTSFVETRSYAGTASVLDPDDKIIARFEGLLRNGTQPLTSFFAEPGEYLLTYDSRYNTEAASGVYSIHASRFDIDIDETEDASGDVSTKYSISDSSFTGTLSDTDPEDWFRFEAVAGTVYWFDITRFGSWQNNTRVDTETGSIPRERQDLDIFDANGNEAEKNVFLERNDTVIFQALTSGALYIRVAPDSDESGDHLYQLEMRTSAKLDETTDAPEDGPANYEIEPGERFSGRLGETDTFGRISINDEVDRISINLTAGQNYRIFTGEEGTPSGLARYAVSLFDPEGERLVFEKVADGLGYKKSLRGPADFDHFATETGTYTIEIKKLSAGGFYTISTSVDPNHELDGDIPGDATSEQLLPEASFFGYVESPDDQDWFKTTLVADTLNNFSIIDPDLTALNASGVEKAQSDFKLSLVAEDGRVLASSDDPEMPQFAFRSPRDLDAFLVVSGQNPGSMGYYELRQGLPFVDGSFGSASNDFLDFGADWTEEIKLNLYRGGNDTVFAGRGNDEIRTGPGDDLIKGRGGDDNLISPDGNDTFIGGLGNDLFKVTGNTDGLVKARGGIGQDTLDVSEGQVTYFGGKGADFTVVGSGSSVKATGGAGANDYLMTRRLTDYSASSLVITDFKPGKDKLRIDEDLFEGSDLIAYIRENADIGAKRIAIDFNFDSRVTLRGITDLEEMIGSGSIQIDVAGKTILGTDREDRIETGPGDDLVNAEGGDDVIISRTGADILDGEYGDDLFIVRNTAENLVTAKGFQGRDTIKVHEGNVLFLGGDARDTTIVFGGSNVTASGGRKDDIFVMKYTETDYMASELTITDFSTGFEELRLDRRLLDGADAEDALRSAAQVTAEGIILDLKFGSRVTLNLLNDLDALISDTVFI